MVRGIEHNPGSGESSSSENSMNDRKKAVVTSSKQFINQVSCHQGELHSMLVFWASAKVQGGQTGGHQKIEREKSGRSRVLRRKPQGPALDN